MRGNEGGWVVGRGILGFFCIIKITSLVVKEKDVFILLVIYNRIFIFYKVQYLV